MIIAIIIKVKQSFIPPILYYLDSRVAHIQIIKSHETFFDKLPRIFFDK